MIRKILFIILISVFVLCSCDEGESGNNKETEPTEPTVPVGDGFYETRNSGIVVEDNNGILHYQTPRIDDMEYYTGKYQSLAELCREKDINLMYVCAASKEIDGYTVLPEGAYSYANENADNFLNFLDDNSYNYLDLRKSLAESGFDKTEIVYKTDHHWTIQAAFEGVSITMEALKSKFNLDITETSRHYNEDKKAQAFLGSQGRQIKEFAENYSVLDDITFILPDFDTDYRVWFQPDESQEPNRSGRFEDEIFRPAMAEDADVTVNKYASYFGSDFGYLKIKNLSNTNGKRIILIKDSYGIPFGAFLSLNVSELIMIDLRGFPELKISLKDYITEYNPDCVLFLYGVGSFDKPMFYFD